MDKLLYFAFGSNMLHSRLAERVGTYGPVTKVRNYSLSGYKLLFNAGSSPYFSFANIEAYPEDSVEGVLYDLNESQIGHLDFYEGYPRNYEKFYIIDTINNVRCIIFGYWAVNPHFKVINGMPGLKYLNIVLEGAFNNGLLNTYGKLLQYKIDNYDIKSARDLRTGVLIRKKKKLL